MAGIAKEISLMGVGVEGHILMSGKAFSLYCNYASDL
jgi:hypothetical protein